MKSLGFRQKIRPNGHSQARRALLGIEALEDRALLAAAAVVVDLYQDNGGALGAPLAASSVQVGEKFFAQINVQEFDPTWTGLAAVSVSVYWNPSILTEVDAPFDAANIITPDLPVAQTGTLDNATGQIQNLSGESFTSANLGAPIGGSGPQMFALLQFQAIASGESPLALGQGSSGTVSNLATPVSASQIDYQCPTVTVIAASDSSSGTSTSTGAPTGTAPTAPVTTGSPSPTSGGTTTTSTPVLSPTPATTATAAAIGLTAQLYADNDGQVGSAISANSLTVGESFFVEIDAQDLRSQPQGIGGLSVNVSWNPAVLQEIDQPFSPTTASSPSVTSAFPLFRSGTLDNTAGQITDLGGAEFSSSGSGTAIGATGPQEFSLLQFTALATATTSPLSLALGSSGAGLVGDTSTGDPTVTAAPLNLTVAAPTSPPQIAITGSSDAVNGTIQFTTDLGSGSTASVSTLVRPALPDTKQFIDVTNTGGSPLTISQIQINAPDVSTSVPPITSAAGDLVLAPGQTRQIELTYAPTLPSAQDADTETFNLPTGLVIVSNAANTPQLSVGLAGASTFDADINYDGRVDIADVVLLDGEMGAHSGQASYAPAADPNGDGSIDLADFGVMNVEFGQSRSTATPALLSSPVTPTISSPATPTNVTPEVVAPSTGALNTVATATVTPSSVAASPVTPSPMTPSTVTPSTVAPASVVPAAVAPAAVTPSIATSTPAAAASTTESNDMAASSPTTSTLPIPAPTPSATTGPAVAPAAVPSAAVSPLAVQPAVTPATTSGSAVATPSAATVVVSTPSSPSPGPVAAPTAPAASPLNPAAVDAVLATFTADPSDDLAAAGTDDDASETGIILTCPSGGTASQSALHSAA